MENIRELQKSLIQVSCNVDYDDLGPLGKLIFEIVKNERIISFNQI